MTILEHIDAVTSDIINHNLTLKEATENFQRLVIMGVLYENDWHETNSAKLLGVHRNSLDRKMDELGIPKKRAASSEAFMEAAKRA